MNPTPLAQTRWQSATRTPQAHGTGPQVVGFGRHFVAIPERPPGPPRATGLSSEPLASMGRGMQARRQARLLPLGCALRVASLQIGQSSLGRTLWDSMAWLGEGWVEVAQAAAIAPPA